jgi:hypothetical protein
MITSFEVGSVFRIIDEASPGLRKILAQVRELTKAIDTARASLAEFSKSVVPGIAGAIKETDALAGAWGRVSESAAAASKSITRASESARASAAAATGGIAGGGARGGGRHGPGRFGGGSAGHAGLAMGGLAADAIYQAAELQKEAYLAWWHSGMADTPGSQQQIRSLIQNATSATGYNFKEVGEASEDIFRLMKGTKDNGLGAAPELLRAGATEALIKGTGLKESTKSLIEMAHMMGVYDPDQLKAMAPMIGFLSTLNPATLPQFTRSASYSVPTLSNALGIRAADVLFANTAIARAGATGSKSGTWVEHAFDRALPPDPNTMGDKAYSRRMWSMEKAGLVDANGKSTILGADGGIDIEKFLDTTRAHLALLPIGMRNSIEKAVFGEQGARGYELLTSPQVMDQTRRLKAEAPDFVPKYNAFMEQYGERSTIQKARTTYADFNNLLADIGDKALPSVNRGLSDLRGILDGLRSVIPGGAKGDDGLIGARAGQGALIGALAGGIFGLGGGAVPGAAIGAVAGGALGVAEQYMQNLDRPVDRFGRATVVTGNSAAQAAEGMEALGRAIRGLPGPGSVFPGGTSRAVPPVTLNLNIDGKTLARAVSSNLLDGFPTGGMSSDGLGAFGSGDDNKTDH